MMRTTTTTARPPAALRAAAAPRARTVSVRASQPKDAAANMASRGKEWIATILSRFGPTRERAQNVSTLDFEKPLVQLDQRIREVSIPEGAAGGGLYKARQGGRFALSLSLPRGEGVFLFCSPRGDPHAHTLWLPAR